ncbi:MAG: pilus assembly protein TadG-related protein [Thermoleophilia bacterium]|nr:pilus assembly protein TadG-related protein [Thermoleophilia bacterium]
MTPQNREEGAVIILVALLMVALLGLVALTVDLGGLYAHDRDLQTLADAGALAGAQELVYSAGDQGLAANMAEEYVSSNAAVSDVVEANLAAWAPVVDDRSVTVDLQEDGVPFFFAEVLGQSEGTVHAHAKASLMYLTGVSQVLPIAIPYMHPHHFRLIYTNQSNGFSFDYTLTDPNLNDLDADQGEYGGFRTTPSAPEGSYSIDLRAETEKNEEIATLEGVGLWRAFPATGPVLWVSISQDESAKTVGIRVKTAAFFIENSLRARIGNSNITLQRDPNTAPPAEGEFLLNNVPIPTGGQVKEGYEVVSLDLVDNKLGLAQSEVARFFVAKMPYPIFWLEQLPENPELGGYSRPAGTEGPIGGRVKVRVFKFDEEATLKIGFNSSGEWDGNQFWADIYKEASNLDQELNPQPGWTPYYPLEVGSYLKSYPGGHVGQVDLDHLIGKTVVIPFVEPAIIKGRDEWRIQTFAAFEITSWGVDQSKTVVNGKFVHWLDSGPSTDIKPPGLYMETAVLTE